MSLQTVTTAAAIDAANAPQFEVRFESLFEAGRAMSFPCDCDGHVDLDALPAQARNNYLFARAMVGKDYLPPAVRGCRH